MNARMKSLDEIGRVERDEMSERGVEKGIHDASRKRAH